MAAHLFGLSATPPMFVIRFPGDTNMSVQEKPNCLGGNYCMETTLFLLLKCFKTFLYDVVSLFCKLILSYLQVWLGDAITFHAKKANPSSAVSSESLNT